MNDVMNTVVSSGTDWIAVFTFALVAVIYFLAPVLGWYPAERRGLLMVALYLLIAYGLVGLLQLILSYFFFLGSGNISSPKWIAHLTFLFAMLKLVVYIASQLAFVLGLQGLKRGGDFSWRKEGVK